MWTSVRSIFPRPLEFKMSRVRARAFACLASARHAKSCMSSSLLSSYCNPTAVEGHNAAAGADAVPFEI